MSIRGTSLADLVRDRGAVAGEVKLDVHPRDGMWKGDPVHYQACGRDALYNVALALSSARAGSPRRILDFACGFGRVARHLRAAFPDAEIIFADAMPDACAFCADAFEGESMPVAKDFAGFDPRGLFDLIWVGSLFTHLAQEKAQRLFQLLSGALAPGGVLVFTSHGRYVRDRRSQGKWPYEIDAAQYDALIAEISTCGYGFVPYKNSVDYGISLATLGWWEDVVGGNATSEFVMLRERGWDRHQDVLAITRK